MQLPGIDLQSTSACVVTLEIDAAAWASPAAAPSAMDPARVSSSPLLSKCECACMSTPGVALFCCVDWRSE